MRTASRYAVFATMVAGTLIPPTLAHGGAFLIPIACDTLSQNPLRIRLSFGFYDRGGLYAPLCAVRVASFSDQGSATYPILECTAPSRLRCSVDSTGAAVYVASPCINALYGILSDSVSIVVEQVSYRYQAILYTTGGLIRKVDEAGFPCSEIGTPTIRSRWGELLRRFRAP
jgi:hypothetical protein